MLKKRILVFKIFENEKGRGGVDTVSITYYYVKKGEKTMGKKKRLTHQDEQEIAHAYEKLLIPCAELSKGYGVTRQRIWQILQGAGVDTTKKGGLLVICDYCHKEFKKPRCRVRAQFHNFCSSDCYYAWLADRSKNWKPWRHGIGTARRKVAEAGFNLQDSHVVHHEDGDSRNNSVENLRVFNSQEDRLKYHRGFAVIPIWEGCKEK